MESYIFHANLRRCEFNVKLLTEFIDGGSLAGSKYDDQKAKQFYFYKHGRVHRIDQCDADLLQEFT